MSNFLHAAREEAALVLQGHWLQIKHDQVDAIITLAEAGWPNAHDALCNGADKMISNNEAMPDRLREYIINLARGGRTKSGMPGKNAFDNFGRNICIVVAIKRLVEMGLTATRNEASHSLSACGIVAEVYPRFGVNLSEKAVNKIWQKHLADERGKLRAKHSE
jgi:hypothetical protein